MSCIIRQPPPIMPIIGISPADWAKEGEPAAATNGAMNASVLSLLCRLVMSEPPL
jgi:hypothetical protein